MPASRRGFLAGLMAACGVTVAAAQSEVRLPSRQAECPHYYWDDTDWMLVGETAFVPTRGPKVSVCKGCGMLRTREVPRG